MPCSEMTRYFVESRQLIFKKICALVIFKQIIYKLSIYFCIQWMISPRYIGSIIKYLKAWNLFLACLYKSDGLFLKKEHMLYDHFDLHKLLRISMMQCVTNEGLVLVNQVIDAANNLVQYLDPSFFNPINFSCTYLNIFCHLFNLNFISTDYS